MKSVTRLFILMLFLPVEVLAVPITGYFSPKNSGRPVRRRTDYIILHTTEGAKEGSLRKLYRNGEAHYFIDEVGRIYNIISRRRVAFHAGRSMWQGRTNLDDYSIGIEVVGYHNKPITTAQYKALKELLSWLQGIYRVPDDKVLTHSMIAYGAPNRWHKKPHRGRKRCGMQFAQRSVRYKLGLSEQPLYDPDVKAGRLIIADYQLARALYGSAQETDTASRSVGNVIAEGRSAWDIAGYKYNNPDTTYVFPDGRTVKGNTIKSWSSIPAGTTVTVGKYSAKEKTFPGMRMVGRDGKTARDIIGDASGSKTTIYLLPDGAVKRGDELNVTNLDGLPEGTRVVTNYIYGGYITSRRSAFDICGPQWNAATTFYVFADGVMESGDTVDERQMPKNTLVLYRQ